MKRCLSLLITLLIVASVSAQDTGILRGVVNDDLGNLVGHAELKFQCENSPENLPEFTDKFGSFFIKTMPYGNCRIFAFHKGSMSYTDVEINSSMHDIEISLKRRPSFAGYFLLSFLLVLLILLTLWITKKIKKKTLNKHERKTTILQTLPQKEKAIVEYMLNNKNECSNSQVKHNLHIPRTSLSRLVTSLENKHIIEVEKHGKALKLKLTEFFLKGKDLEQK